MDTMTIAIPEQTKSLTITCVEPVDLSIRQELSSSPEVKISDIPSENINQKSENGEFHITISGHIETDDAEIIMHIPAEMQTTVKTTSGSLGFVKVITDIEVSSSSGSITVDEFSGKSAEFSIESGDVEITGASGNIKISVISGDVEVSDFEGSLLCKSVSGEIKLSDVEGSFEISVQSGDIEADSIMGDISLSTVSGDINLNGVTVERLKAESVSGDINIDADVLEEESTLEAKTVSGDITLQLPDETDAKIKATVKTGEIILDTDPHKLEIGEETGQTVVNLILTDAVEIAMPSVILETLSGDIDISA